LHIKKWENHKQLIVDRNVWSPVSGLVIPLPGASSMRFLLLLTASILYRRITMSHSSHKWLKIWINSLTDPDLDNLTISHFGRWVKLLLYAKTHGENGILKIKQPAKSFCLSMQIENIESFNEIAKNLPNISISCNGDNGVTIYTVKNWYKYQIDDSKERVEKHRETQKSVTPQEKRREEKSKRRKEKSIFIPPSVEEVKTYCKERTNEVDPYKWFDWYKSNGWMVGKNKMKDWRASVRTWERNKKESISEQYADL